MLQKEFTRIPLVFIAAFLALSLLTPAAQAIWHQVLNEHFDYTPQVWSTIANPSQYEQPPRWTVSPYHQWGQTGSPWTWGIESEIYQPGYGGQYTRALWCVGLPGDLDPLQEPYPINVDSWANFGAFSLSTAQAAKATFWFRYQTESSADYLAWGPGVESSFYEVDRRSGPSTTWYFTTVNFDSIPNGSGGYISLLGQSAVSMKFHFHSDASHLSDCMGGFIDELNIRWDDGVWDLVALYSSVARLDSTELPIVQLGDSVRFRLAWILNGGSGVTPMFNITCQLDGQPFYSERRDVNIGELGTMLLNTYSRPWVAPDTLVHTVLWMLDANNEIPNEFSETNNDTSNRVKAQLPNAVPHLQILEPDAGDTSNVQIWISYDAHDPDDTANIDFYWVTDTTNPYSATPVPGGIGLLEHDTTGSLAWNTSSIPDTIVWLQGVIYDAIHIDTTYAGPIVINHSWGLPAITVTSPQTPDTVDAEFLITWLDSDPTDSGHIWLYWDNHNWSYEGVPIPGAANIPTADTTNSFLWNTTTMPNEAVWILAYIHNVNGSQYAYSPAPVVIHHLSGINPWPGLEGIPAQFALENVYPNPFNNSATIRVAVPREAQVQIRIYDTLGRLAATPFHGMLEPGYHDVPWTPDFLPSGMYLVRFSAPGVEMQAKAVYLK